MLEDLLVDRLHPVESPVLDPFRIRLHDLPKCVLLVLLDPVQNLEDSRILSSRGHAKVIGPLAPLLFTTCELVEPREALRVKGHLSSRWRSGSSSWRLLDLLQDLVLHRRHHVLHNLLRGLLRGLLRNLL